MDDVYIKLLDPLVNVRKVFEAMASSYPSNMPYNSSVSKLYCAVLYCTVLYCAPSMFVHPSPWMEFIELCLKMFCSSFAQAARLSSQISDPI